MSFTALTGGGAGGAYIPGDKFGAQTAEKIRTNFNDHETRVSDLEATVASSAISTLDDVGLGSPISDGDLLTFDSGLWTNQAPAVVPLATGVSGNLPLANLPTNFAQIFKATPTALTDAQIKALPTTPITLIAAPSSGTRIKVVGASLRSLFSAGAYTNINATYAALAIYHLGDFSVWPLNGIVKDTSAPGATRFTTMFGADDFVADLGPYLDVPDYTVPPGLQWALPGLMPYATVNGTAIAIAIDNNGSGNLTGGNSANTLKVTMYYTVEAL